MDRAPEGLAMACYDLEQAHGKARGGRRIVVLCGWLGRYLTNLAPRRDILVGCRRVGVTGDLDIEVERVLAAAQETKAKYQFMSGSEVASLPEQLATTVDALCRCVGIDDGADVPERDAEIFARLLRCLFDEATGTEIDAAVRGHGERTVTIS